MAFTFVVGNDVAGEDYPLEMLTWMPLPEREKLHASATDSVSISVDVPL